EFAAGGERRLGSTGVSTARGEQIGEVQAARLHLHQNLLRGGMRVGNLLQFEDFGTAETSDDEGFHGESLTVMWRDGSQPLAGRGRPALRRRVGVVRG